MAVMSVTPRRALLALSVLLALAAAGYTAYWFHVAGEARKGLDRWAAERRAEGWTVAWQQATVSGFPGRVLLGLEQPRLVSPGGVGWGTARLTAALSPFAPARIHLTAPGRHDLGWAGESGSLEARDLSADIAVDRFGRLESAQLSGGGLAGETPFGAMTVEGLSLGVESSPPPVGRDKPTAHFSVLVYGVELPPAPGLILDRRLGLAAIGGRVMGAIPVAPPLDAFRQWSRDGGVLELERVELDWQPLGLEAEGTVAFDAGLQPIAALSARVSGMNAFMDHLAAAGVVERGASTALKLLMGLMSKPDSRGRPAVQMPVTLQDGALFLGPARMLELPPVPWPAG